MSNAGKLVVLGAGNIGQALLGGLTRESDWSSWELVATRRSARGCTELSQRFPEVAVTTDNAAAVSGAHVVVVAVKPTLYPALMAEIKPHLSAQTLVVSVLAGVSTKQIEQKLHDGQPVVRTMPNTPMLVDHGATAMAGGSYARPEQLALVERMFGAIGIVEVVSEDQLDAVTGLSGSGPAYIYMIIEALTDGGVKQGLPRAVAHRLAAQTVLGAAKLVIDTGRHPALLRDEVTTPGGTAIAAVADLESHGLRTMLINAVATATDRSKTLRALAEEMEDA